MIGHFGTLLCTKICLDDLHFEHMAQFPRTARLARQFRLCASMQPPQLEHPNLGRRGRITNVAVLSFREPLQSIVTSPAVECADRFVITIYRATEPDAQGGAA